MLQTSASSSSFIPPLPNTIQSRFGEIAVDAEKALTFQSGLLGLPDKRHFALAQFPGEKMRQFMVLQSLDDVKLSFITLPAGADTPLIAAADIAAACADLQIPHTGVALLFIVSVHRSPAEVKLSINARAPIFIDTSRRLGVQYVFQNDRYKVQQML